MDMDRRQQQLIDTVMSFLRKNGPELIELGERIKVAVDGSHISLGLERNVNIRPVLLGIIMKLYEAAQGVSGVTGYSEGIVASKETLGREIDIRMTVGELAALLNVATIGFETIDLVCKNEEA